MCHDILQFTNRGFVTGWFPLKTIAAFHWSFSISPMLHHDFSEAFQSRDEIEKYIYNKYKIAIVVLALNAHYYVSRQTSYHLWPILPIMVKWVSCPTTSSIGRAIVRGYCVPSRLLLSSMLSLLNFHSFFNNTMTLSPPTSITAPPQTM